MKQELKISKLDAAKRQLETVIRLYFLQGDPVSIHTLAAAAYNVIRDITTRRGVATMLIKDELSQYVRPEHEQAFRRKINEAENFFKHGDRDQEATLDFNPQMSEFFVFDACRQYERLTGEQPPLFLIYRTWFMANHPRMFILPEEITRNLRANAASIVSMGRTGFFNSMLPWVMSRV